MKAKRMTGLAICAALLAAALGGPSPARGEERTAKPVVQLETPSEAAPEGIVCPECGSDMVVREGRYGRFLACRRYPECKGSLPLLIGVDCPSCGKPLAEKRTRKGKLFYGCSEYPDCTYIVNNRPYPTPCPKCANPFLVYKGTKTGDGELFCPAEGCGYSREVDQKDLEKLEKK